MAGTQDLITAGDFKDPRLRLLWRNVKALDQDTFDRIKDGKYDFETADKIWLFTEEVRKAIAAIFEAFDIQQGEISFQGTNVAWQLFQTSASNLSASDDPDDVSVPRSVLATDGKAQSPYQFEWRQAGNGSQAIRPSQVIFGPGAGVTGKTVIVDHTEANINLVKLEADAAVAVMTSDNVVRNYGTSGLKLQTGEWRVTDAGVWQFWPSSMAEDVWVLLRQVLPPVSIA